MYTHVWVSVYWGKINWTAAKCKMKKWSTPAKGMGIKEPLVVCSSPKKRKVCMLVTVIMYMWCLLVYVCAIMIGFVHYCVVFRERPGISKLWNHLRQRVLWVFNEAVCINAGLTKNYSLEHLRKSSFKLCELCLTFSTTQRLKNSMFNHQSIWISHPLKCQNPKLGAKCLFRISVTSWGSMAVI